MVDNIQFLDITVEDGRHDEAVLRILAAAKPNWTRADIKQSQMSGGWINTMYCCHLAQDEGRLDAVMVRIYSSKTADMDEKYKEFIAIQIAVAAGTHAPLKAVFNNGLVYTFVPGRLPDVHEFTDPQFIQKLTKKMCQLHHVDLDSVELMNRKQKKICYDKTLDELSRIKTFTADIPTETNDPSINEAFQGYRKEFTNDVIFKELEFVVSILRHARLPLSFIHGDIHGHNMVIDSRSEDISLIDFEFASYSYRYWDLAFIFIVWKALPWLGVCQPGEYPLTPELRQQYIEAYIDAQCELEGRDRKSVSRDESDLVDLQHQVAEFAATFNFMVEPLAFINAPGVESSFVHFHKEAKDLYHKLKATMKDVVAKITDLDRKVTAARSQEATKK